MNYCNKKIKIIGVPIDLGSKPLGVEMGPSAIRHAGLIEALKYNNYEYFDYGDIYINQRGKNRKDGQLEEILRISEHLSEIVNESINNNFIPVILGGDHSASIGSIAGASKRFKKLGLIWIDCHPDSNTPETSPTGNIHGMTVAISLGYGNKNLVHCAGFSPKILPENVCMIGINDIDAGERIFLEKNNIKYYTMYDITKNGIVKVLDETIERLKDCDGIHLSFDVDVLDPVIAPGTGIISRGGLSYREISYTMNMLGQLSIIHSIDIIEINPLLDIRNETSELAVELLLSLLKGSYGDYERKYISKQN